MIIDSDEIKNLLPHRHPFLFLDKCKIIEVGTKGVGYRKFLPNEYFFNGLNLKLINHIYLLS